MMPTKVAVAWLRKEDWPRWRLIDPELPPHAEWHSKTEGVMKMLTSRGQAFEKIAIDPGAFVAWRATTTNWRGGGDGRAARSAYATAILAGQGMSRH